MRTTKYRNLVLLAVLGLMLALVLPGVVLAQPKIPHTLEGRSACTTCHQVGASGVGATGGTGLPADHAGRTDATCQGCHQLASAAPAAQPTSTTAPAPTAAPAKPAASPTTAPALPAAPAVSPTAAPPPPAASPAATPGALPRTGGFPVAPFALAGGGLLMAIGWSLRKIIIGH